MYKRHKYDIVIILAVAGFAVSLYLAISHYLGFAVPCSITQGCETVLSSKYSMLFGFPLSVWGVGYFFAVIVSSLLANHYAIWKKLLTSLLGIGALASIIFLSLQFFVIKKVCQYCLIADLLSIILFIIDINIEHQKTTPTLPNE
jgi:uncharacterized membrane protein